MTYYPRFQPVTGTPDEAYRNYDGAGIVSIVLALTDWWLQRRARARLASTTSANRAHAIPFSLALLAAIECDTAVSAEMPAGLVCGGDYVCVAESPAPVAAPTARVEPQQHQQPSVGAAFIPTRERCTDALVDVTANSQDERHLACTAASDALKLLGRCQIAPRWPLHIEIKEQVRHPLGRVVFGLLDTKRQRILVTQKASIAALAEGTPYAPLPLREFYRSLVVHEVVHGVMDQNLKRAGSTHAAYEYPAYAIQIESLPVNVRDEFLQSFDQAAIKAGAAMFNDAILFFDPYFFAARAYHHLQASPDRCAVFAALLEGEADFISAQM